MRPVSNWQASKAATGLPSIPAIPESTLIGEIYAGALEAKGVTVKKTFNIGSREVYLKALKDGSIDLIAEYTGSLSTFLNKKASAKDSEGV